jgi:hypothetical protein
MEITTTLENTALLPKVIKNESFFQKIFKHHLAIMIVLTIFAIIGSLCETIPKYIRYAKFKQGVVPDYVTVEVGRNTRTTILPSIFIDVPFNLNMIELKQLYIKNNLCGNIYLSSSFCNETEETLMTSSCTFKNSTVFLKEPFNYKTCDSLIEKYVWQYDQKLNLLGNDIYYYVFNEYTIGIRETPFVNLLFVGIYTCILIILIRKYRLEFYSSTDDDIFRYVFSIYSIFSFLVLFGLLY